MLSKIAFIFILSEPSAALQSCYEKHEKVPQVMHETLLKLFAAYIVVGGMPDVVQNVSLNLNNFSNIMGINISLDNIRHTANFNIGRK